jgi:hypothetical protein
VPCQAVQCRARAAAVLPCSYAVALHSVLDRCCAVQLRKNPRHMQGINPGVQWNEARLRDMRVGSALATYSDDSFSCGKGDASLSSRTAIVPCSAHMLGHPAAVPCRAVPCSLKIPCWGIPAAVPCRAVLAVPPDRSKCSPR